MGYRPEPQLITGGVPVAHRSGPRGHDHVDVRVTFTVALYDQTMPQALTVVLYVLAVARITTLVTLDEISRPVRKALVRRFDPSRRLHRWVVYLLGDAEDETANGCPWCVSVWVGLLSAPAVWVASDSPYVLVPVLGLAASQATGMIFQVGRR